jgi:hypothetical protein
MVKPKSGAGRKIIHDAKLGRRRKRSSYYDAYPFGGAGGGNSRQ